MPSTRQPSSLASLASLAFVLVSAVASADAHDPSTDVPHVDNAGSPKTLGVTTVECETPTGTPRVARCTFVRATLIERGNHTCALSATSSVLNMTQSDANTWRNDWPATGSCNKTSSTLLLRGKKNKNKWTVKDTSTVPRVPAGSSQDLHTECDAHVGTTVEVSDAETHRPRKIDCELLDL